jgi:hypothetical protein
VGATLTAKARNEISIRLENPTVSPTLVYRPRCRNNEGRFRSDLAKWASGVDPTESVAVVTAADGAEQLRIAE